MGKLDWHKRNHDKALGGMMGLTLEERGAYNTVLDLIYSHDDQLVDDDRFIAGWCQCDVRVWRRIRESLIGKRKLYVENGLLRNFRATSEVLAGLGRVASARDAGVASGNSRRRKSSDAANRNNDIDRTDVPTEIERTAELTTTTTTTTTKKKDITAQPDGFADWYAAYPLHKGRGAAEKAYIRALKITSADVLLAGAHRDAQGYAGTDPKFIPHPATWLNQQRWLDEGPTNGQPASRQQPPGFRNGWAALASARLSVPDDGGDRQHPPGVAVPEPGRHPSSGPGKRVASRT